MSKRSGGAMTPTPGYLKERVPDLIVLDWMLPGLSGIELCRRLRARDPGSFRSSC